MNIEETTPRAALRQSEKGVLRGDQALVLQAKSGHSGAFGELYERHRLKIYRSVLPILRNQQDAEDAVQQSFQHAFTNLHRFREESAFSTWVVRIAINEALMILRRRHVTTSALETNNDDVCATPLFDLVDEGPTPEQALAQKELRGLVTRAISRLRGKLRSVVLLRELQGLTSAETAQRLGLTISAVKGRTFHARRHLRRHLEGRYRARHRADLDRSRAFVNSTKRFSMTVGYTKVSPIPSSNCDAS